MGDDVDENGQDNFYDEASIGNPSQF